MTIKLQVGVALSHLLLVHGGMGRLAMLLVVGLSLRLTCFRIGMTWHFPVLFFSSLFAKLARDYEFPS